LFFGLPLLRARRLQRLSNAASSASLNRSLAMKNSMTLETAPRLALQAKTATELMTANLVSVRENASLREALALLIDKGFSAAPVIDEAGRPVGVLSRSDLLIHDLESAQYVPEAPEYYHKEELKTSDGEALGRGFQVEKVDRTRVRDLMTPAIFCVAPDATPAKVVHDLLSLKVHRVFVVDENGVLVGVISTFDILRHLRP
jgi:CBS-domain-containing membrane protein